MVSWRQSKWCWDYLDAMYTLWCLKLVSISITSNHKTNHQGGSSLFGTPVSRRNVHLSGLQDWWPNIQGKCHVMLTWHLTWHLSWFNESQAITWRMTSFHAWRVRRPLTSIIHRAYHPPSTFSSISSPLQQLCNTDTWKAPCALYDLVTKFSARMSPIASDTTHRWSISPLLRTPMNFLYTENRISRAEVDWIPCSSSS